MLLYNTPRHNSKGQPICEICEVAYDKLLLHVNKRHNLDALAYKTKFNFHPRKGIQSKTLHALMSKSAKKNYDKVILQNLIINGKQTRFKKGNTQTNKELVSKTSSDRMSAYWKAKKETKQEAITKMIKILTPKK